MGVVDRFLFHPWLARVANAAFVLAALALIVRRVGGWMNGWDSATVVTTVLMALGVVLMLLPHVRNRALPGRLYSMLAPPQKLVDAQIKKGQEVREWMRYYRPEDREARIKVMVWALETANRLADRVPAYWDDWRNTRKVDGAGLGQLIELVDVKLDALKAIRKEL